MIDFRIYFSITPTWTKANQYSIIYPPLIYHLKTPRYQGFSKSIGHILLSVDLLKIDITLTDFFKLGDSDAECLVR